ncbi:hypothetical protein C8Q80DRAFT_1267081 [Daedaleopsis nitida]|nr:hypothetical protein C8Q80DRAFT_1267081 [Daedaleopsis nitida]
MSRIVEESGRREFPFPRMDSLRTASSSGSSSLPSRSDSSQSKSLRSSPSSSVSRPSARRTRLERDDHGDSSSILPGIPTKLLSHLMPPPHHDSRTVRSALAVTTERLHNETRRADDAERRVLEVLRKLRAAHEATMLAQAEASRAKEELTLYKYRLEDANREIARAQELIDELEQQKVEAEEVAARARSTARKYREQQLIARAREEGRLEGLQEGWARGAEAEFEESAVIGEPRERRYGMPTVEEIPDEEERPPAPQYRSRTPGPAEIRVRTPAPEYRSQTPGPSTVSSGRVTPALPRRPPSRFSTSRASTRPHISDTAHHAATLPVPTIVTPLNAPSPSHSRAGTPVGIPVPHPAPRSLDDGQISAPIPIYEPVPSPVHPPVEIPPDGYIPYADRAEEIYLPPPHELSRPVSPVSPTPASAPALHPSQSSHPGPSRASDYGARTRDYAYDTSIPPEGVPITGTRSSESKAMSPLSKASTNISQFDLVGAPSSKLRVSTTGRPPVREDVGSPRGPRPREDFPAPVIPPPPPPEPARGPVRTARVQSPVSTSPLDRVFKNRFLSKSFKDRGRGRDTPPVIPPHVIPDIVIESPSTPSTNRSSVKTTITHPHLLSPEQHNIQPLAPQEDIIVMRTEIPGYHPSSTSSSDQWIPPLASDSPLQFPPGFVPLTPPMPSGSLSGHPIPVPSNTPVPVPSNTPVPIPPPRNPLPIPSRKTVRIPPPSNPEEALPIPHNSPLPIPYDDPLPIRSPSRSGRYHEAPIPAGVVYPEPPSRRATPRTLSPPGGVQRSRLDVRSPGSRLSPLPLSFQIFAPLRSEGTANSVES